MDKRYQVFVSSTYTDLREERSKVIQALMEMDCIPAGMELFPAADEDQWLFIQKVIDDCDYYLLIIGGRYGSLADEGISYTEKEYDYAVSRGIRVIALLHGAPNELPVSRSELEPEKAKRLIKFRNKVASGRLVKFWQHANELPGLVALSLTKTIKMHPAIGWMRADKAAGADVLAEINDLRRRNDELVSQLNAQKANPSPSVAGLATLQAEFNAYGTCSEGNRKLSWEVGTTWAEVFGVLAPRLLQSIDDFDARAIIANRLFKKSKAAGAHPILDYELFQTIKVQFLAHQLINVTPGIKHASWSLTTKGYNAMIDIRSVRDSE